MAVVPVPAFDRVSFVHEGVRVVGTVTAQSPLPVGGWLWTVTLDGGAVVTVDPLRCAYAPVGGIRVEFGDDGLNVFTAALVDVQRWNGWASPWFSEDEGRRIAEHTAALRAEYGDDAELIEWDAARGLFTHDAGYGEDRETFDVQTLDFDGAMLHGIGGWAWTWDEAARIPTAADVAAAIERGWSEILADIADGTVPASVATFSELHDYVDANEYGGLCDEGSGIAWLAEDGGQDAGSRVQAELARRVAARAAEIVAPAAPAAPAAPLSLADAVAAVESACAFYGVTGWDGEALFFLTALMSLADGSQPDAHSAVRAAYGIVY